MSISARILEVTAYELTYEALESNYTFTVYEFPNGTIMVPGQETNDWYFTDRDSVEPNGNAAIETIKDTGSSIEFDTNELRASLEGSISEFGVDEATDKAFTLIKGH